MSKPKRLGRGLEALLGRTADGADPPIHVPAGPATPPDAEGAYGGAVAEPYGPAADAQPVPAPPATQPAQTPVRLSVDLLDRNPFQPRQDFDEDELRTLAESLSEHGLLQPVVVRRSGERFELIAGERRLRAAQLAGWTDVPVQIVEADDRQLAELAIVENLQRKDLNALEKAASFQRYLETYGATQEELASRLKIDRSTVANLIRLLELPEAVQEAVRRGRITQGHARALLPLGDQREQTTMVQRIQQEGLSVRQTEALVQDTIRQADQPQLSVFGSDPSSTKPRRLPSQHVAALEQEFRSALGTKVKITHSSRGRGKLVIHFSSHEEFERLRTQICDGSASTGVREVG